MSGVWIGRPAPREWLKYLAAAAVAWSLVQYAFQPHNAFVLRPVHHDDYSNVARAFPRLSSPPTRPVSLVIIALVGRGGPVVYSFALQGLTVGYASLVLLFVCRFLKRPVSFAAATWLFGVAFLHPRALEWGRYTGLMTNLLSATFGVLALLLFSANLDRGAKWLPALAGLFLLLSALSKEDYVLPSLLLGLWGIVEGANRVAARVNLAIAGVVTGFLVLYNTRIEPNSFTAIRPSGPYAFARSPGSFARVFAGYLMQPGLVLVVTCASLVAVVAALLLRPIRRGRVLVVAGMPAVLIVPYAFLPNHVFPYYSVSWLFWLGSLFIVLASDLVAGPNRSRVIMSAAAVLGWIIAFRVTRAERDDVQTWYSVNAGRARRAEDVLRRNRRILEHEEQVGVLGAEWPSPWTRTDGSYLRDWLGLGNRWIVFADPNSPYFPANEGPLEDSTISVRPLSQIANSASMLILVFDENGNGTLTRHTDRLSAVELRKAAEALEVRLPRAIARLYPSATRAGRQFQRTAAGMSAIAVEGSGFSPSDRILWDGRSLVTTYGSDRFLTALVPDDLIARPGKAIVSVGDARAAFRILSPNEKSAR